jgi:membrane-associated protease RseP (regulator of RpoE activity)
MNAANRSSSEQTTNTQSRLEIIAMLRTELAGILQDAETVWTPPVRRTALLFKTTRLESAITFRGHLRVDPVEGYALLYERFAPLGYTPILRREKGYEIVSAIPVVFSKPSPQHWWINLVLLILTLGTTTLMGAIMEQGELLVQNPLLFFQEPALLLTGIPASLTIMGILGIHELAHYFAARQHGLDSSLPYFIPIPLGFGTFGAIIRMRTPWKNRNALFDVGAAGPLAGISIALPLFFLGLISSPAMAPQPDGMPLGTPLLLQWLESLVYLIKDIPSDYDIYVNSWTFAAWFGLVVSGFNLLPIGQLDGGHVAYAVLGKRTKTLSILVLVTLGVLGLLLWPGWYLWIAFTFLSGWMHPPPLNMLEPLSRKRQILGVIIFILMILMFTPSPFPAL